MNWTTHAALILTAVTTVILATPGARARKRDVAFRIDGRTGSWRVDMKTLSFEPWEAIDGGQGFRSAAEAKRYVVAYRRAIVAQATLMPKDVARPATKAA